MIRYLSANAVKDYNYSTATWTPIDPRECQLRILTGDDADRACGSGRAVLEVPAANGGAFYFTGRELLAFAALMDATDQ